MVGYGKIKRYMKIGLIGALITVCAEMLQGAVPSGDAADKMTALFSSFDDLPLWRIGLGSTVGALGILLQFFGVYGIAFSNMGLSSTVLFAAVLLCIRNKEKA